MRDGRSTWHRALRLSLKGASFAVAVVCVCGLLVSIRYVVYHSGQSGIIGLSHGCVNVWTVLPPPGRHTVSRPVGWQSMRRTGPFIWTPRTDLSNLFVPLWLPAVAATAVFLWARRRMPRPGACYFCGYDVAGLHPSSPCPECGHVNLHQSTNMKSDDTTLIVELEEQ